MIWSREIYQKLSALGLDILYDDRDLSAGEKFKDADLIGCGLRAIVSKRSLASGGVELMDRYQDESRVGMMGGVEKCFLEKQKYYFKKL
jgi:prolyl-tRNA synthetase